jgi:hypothetical protein
MPAKDNDFGETINAGPPKAEGLYIALVEQGTQKSETRTRKDGSKYDSHRVTLKMMHRGDGVNVKGRFNVTLSREKDQQILTQIAPILVSVEVGNDYFNVNYIGTLLELQSMAKEMGY